MSEQDRFLPLPNGGVYHRRTTPEPVRFLPVCLSRRRVHLLGVPFSLWRFLQGLGELILAVAFVAMLGAVLYFAGRWLGPLPGRWVG